MLELINNIYVKFAFLCIFTVAIMKYVIIPIIEGIVKGRSLTNSKKIIAKLKVYLYPVIPLIFAVAFSRIAPVEKKMALDIILYFGGILLVFKLLFKTITDRFKKEIKG